MQISWHKNVFVILLPRYQQDGPIEGMSYLIDHRSYILDLVVRIIQRPNYSVVGQESPDL